MKTPLEAWVDRCAQLMQPDKIYWMDGSEDEARRLVEIGKTEEKIDGNYIFSDINADEYPHSFYHRSHPTDVSRTEHLTFVCLPNKDDAGPNNNWMDPAQAKEKMYALYAGCMKGRTLYVIPFMMGHPSSPYAKPCAQISDSAYVAVSMRIMTHLGKEAIARIGTSDTFFKGVHSIGTLNPENRWIMHFPQENTVMSFGSGYGGNALLGKKCYALRIASYLGYTEGWLAEHMIVIGVESPDGEITYFLGAFPSACGKTNLALLDPTLKGYKVWTLGDDIAWINVGKDGRLYAINPENGFFGVAPGTSEKTNPVMIQTLKNNKFFPTLFTNTALDTDTRTPWWEGLTSTPPAHLIGWEGKPYDPASGKPAAHPNSRFTVSIKNCPTLSKEYDNPNGVPISGIIFGGRRKTTVPLVAECFNWDHGVFSASIMGSETTAAATQQQGVVRRDPMAMLPFCGYNMGDYFKHWLSFKTRAKHLPKIFMVNWFKKDDDGSFRWPGYRENSRVIKWMIDRVKNKGAAQESLLGNVPVPADLDFSGLSITETARKKLFDINTQDWKKEIADIEEFYAKFGDRIPRELHDQLAILKKKLDR